MLVVHNARVNVVIIAPRDDLSVVLANRPVARPSEPYAQVLFPLTGVVSVLVPMGEEPSVEAGVIGYEGMVGGSPEKNL